jgi:DUF1009 family protein
MTLIDTSKCVPAGEGVLGSVEPTSEHISDIEFGWELLGQIVDMRIGNAMVVRERDVIAVEATEGIVPLIRRAGELCRKKGWVLLKSAGERDVAGGLPVVDAQTIQEIAGAGGSCLAVNATGVLLADKASVIAAADRHKVALVGVAEGIGNTG